MNDAVSNATPLIYLAKTSQLGLLDHIYDRVFIPEAVYREVVVEGKKLKEKDAYYVERAIKEGWIIVEHVKSVYPLDIPVHPGEAEVISLAKVKGIDTVITDDAKARAVCEVAGLRPVGILYLMLRAVKDHLLDFDQFLLALEAMVECGFYLKEEVYLRAIRMARTLSDDCP